jgi:hypothetical protein
MSSGNFAQNFGVKFVQGVQNLKFAPATIEKGAAKSEGFPLAARLIFG